MPKFMDYHDDLKLPGEVIDSLATGAREKSADEYGVTQLEAYYNDQGKVYCLLDAPDETAVRQHHAALGVGCGEVHEVHTLL